MKRLPIAACALVVLGSCSSGASRSSSPTPTDPVTTPVPSTPATSPLTAEYGPVAARIIAAAARDRGTWTKLEELAVHIGPRLAGSDGLEKAIAWAAKTMRDEGHENVRVEKVMVPHWVRGAESARLVSPREQSLPIIGLGGTAPTPAGGITAGVLVVSSQAELDSRAAEAKGKIVLFNVIMPAYDREKGDGYDAVYKFRNSGADWAAKHGAVAVLVRSLTTRSLATPHTGGVRYMGKTRLPAAAITTEGAEMLARLAKRAPVRVELKLASERKPDAVSGNVIGELRGREKPEEIILIGAHIDAWDIGQGAHDDAGGCAVMMQTLTLLRSLNLRPRRTIRVVLFTNEENGLKGAISYATDHRAEIPRHVLAMESDGGVFAPRGFTVEGPRGLQDAKNIAALIAPLRAMEVKEGFSGADLIPLRMSGVPGIGHWTEGEKYFDYHHTEADTIDKVDPVELTDNLAAVAVFAYVAADMPDRFGGPHAADPPAEGKSE